MATTQVEFVEAFEEPRHKTVLQNNYLRILRVQFPPKSEKSDASQKKTPAFAIQDRTLYHRHQLDSFYIDLANARLLNEMVGHGDSEVNAKFGGISYKAHSEAPYIHRITCLEEATDWFCLDGELLSPPSVAAPEPLSHHTHRLVLESDRLRIYRVTLQPGTGAEEIITYCFHGVLVALCNARLSAPVNTYTPGDVMEITPGSAMPSNVGDVAFDGYLVELLA